MSIDHFGKIILTFLPPKSSTEYLTIFDELSRKLRSNNLFKSVFTIALQYRKPKYEFKCISVYDRGESVRSHSYVRITYCDAFLLLKLFAHSS